MPKDDGTGTSSQSGGNGDGTAERPVPPQPVVGRHHLQEEGCGSETLLSHGNVGADNNNGANEDGWFRMNVPPLII
jgi:hypothetical protein